MVFFLLITSTKVRSKGPDPPLCWSNGQIFDVVTQQWSTPVPKAPSRSKILEGPLQPRSSDPAGVAAFNNKLNGMLPNSPSPRGGHTCSLIEGKLYVFGGYGGPGYSRRDLDDLHILDTATWNWTKASTKVSPSQVIGVLAWW